MKELLLLLCNYPPDPGNSAVLAEQLTRVPDWNSCTELINNHGIIALAFYNIREAGLTNTIPSHALSFLEKGYMKSMVRNTWLTERWREVNSVLSGAGIEHILLKGMALEHTLYGSRGLRQMNDNDILVRREDAIRAWQLLQDKGFTAKPLKSPLHKKILPDLGKHLPELTRDAYTVEIHTRLFDEAVYDKILYDKIFADAVPVNIGDIRALTLPADVNIRYLIKHFNYHKLEGDCQLRLYTDILLLNAGDPPEFPESFIMNPQQKADSSHHRKSYRTAFRAVPAKYRLRFVAGDIFPSLWWMKERYRCGSTGAMLRYPARLGKVFWCRGPT